MKRLIAVVVALELGVVALAASGAQGVALPGERDVIAAFAKQGIRISVPEARAIGDDVQLALAEAAAHGIGDSKVDFAAVEIASRLKLDTSPGSNTVRNVVAALRWLQEQGFSGRVPRPSPAPPVLAWDRYFDDSISLWNQPGFLSLVRQRGFSPVKISWEDIGRYQNSVWGDRISDVGIWVRRDERDPASARLALSVRRDQNFRDNVLVVPAERIRIHQRVNGRTVEKGLPQRLAELGLASGSRDRDVIVSNQFAIVPVPARSMRGAWPDEVPPRAAFTFSIFPYGSTNFVITDVIEGSHEAIVGPGQHQLLFANVDGERAPFTASRAEDRQDLLKLESELKAKGMDVDVQRYYLIQVPLRRDATGVQLSNMGAPPWPRPFPAPDFAAEGGVSGVETEAPGGVIGGVIGGLPQAPPPASQAQIAEQAPRAGLSKVAIGHGEVEGPYNTGSGQRGARAEEPIRVTVVYFVTPVGQVTQKDMETFAAAFAQWDTQAIWGGSFVTKKSQ